MKPGIAESATHDPEPEWPLTLTRAELAALYDRLEISVSAASPLAPLVRTGPNSGLVDPDPLHLSPQVVDALRVLAAPRQLLLLRNARGGNAADGQLPRGFLNDDTHVVRFDVGSRGCIVDRPWDIEGFVLLVSELVSMRSGQGAEDPTTMVSQRFLEAIVALRQLGLFSSEEPIARDEIEAAIGSIPGCATGAPQLLSALERDGVLSIGEQTVLAQPQWRERNPHLVRPAQLALEAIELADLQAGRVRRRRVAVLGDPAARVLFLPTACDEPPRHVALEMRPATPDAVAGAVRQALAAPLAPPTSPVLDGRCASLDTAGPSQVGGSASQWRLSTLEQLIAPLDSGQEPPAALLAPCATIEVTSAAPATGGLARHLFSLDGQGAAEWALSGSWVRWRELEPCEILQRLGQLIPAGAPASAGPAAGTVPASVVRNAFGENGTSTRTAVSPLCELHTTFGEQDLTLHLIRSRCGADAGRREDVLLVVSSASESSWRLQYSGDDRLTFKRATADEIGLHVRAAAEDGQAAPEESRGSGSLQAPRSRRASS